MHLDFPFDQRKGHRVVMPFIVDMVINMNPGCLDVTILIAMLLEYRRFQIIRHQYFWCATKEFKGTHMGVDEVRLVLAPGGFSISVTGRPPCRDKQLCVTGVTCIRYSDCARDIPATPVAWLRWAISTPDRSIGSRDR